MAKGRVRNIAEPKEVAKVLRANSPHVPAPDMYMITSLDPVIDNFKEMFEDLLYCAPRPTETLLSSATLLAWEGVEKAEAQAFAQRIVSAVSYIRSKASSATSGKKITSSCIWLVPIDEEDPASNPWTEPPEDCQGPSKKEE